MRKTFVCSGMILFGCLLSFGQSPKHSKQPLGPVVITWQSIRYHTLNVGQPDVVLVPLGISLNPSGGSTTVEPRLGGIQHIQVSFGMVVQLTGEQIVATNISTKEVIAAESSSIDESGELVSINFSSIGLPDKSYYQIDLSSCVEKEDGTPILGDLDCLVGSLVGDVNGSFLVDNSDLIRIRVNYNTNLGNRFQYDIDLNGVIDNGDLLLARSRRGNSIPN